MLQSQHNQRSHQQLKPSKRFTHEQQQQKYRVFYSKLKQELFLSLLLLYAFCALSFDSAFHEASFLSRCCCCVFNFQMYRKMSHATSWECLSKHSQHHSQSLNAILGMMILAFEWPFFAGILVLAEFNEYDDTCLCLLLLLLLNQQMDVLIQFRFHISYTSRTWHRSYKCE